MILRKDVAESDDIKPAGGGRECWPSIEMIRRMFQKSKLMFLQEKKRIQDMYRILDPGLLLPPLPVIFMQYF